MIPDRERAAGSPKGCVSPQVVHLAVDRQADAPCSSYAHSMQAQLESGIWNLMALESDGCRMEGTWCDVMDTCFLLHERLSNQQSLPLKLVVC